MSGTTKSTNGTASAVEVMIREDGTFLVNGEEVTLASVIKLARDRREAAGAAKKAERAAKTAERKAERLAKARLAKAEAALKKAEAAK